jgi:hypothetical protein
VSKQNIVESTIELVKTKYMDNHAVLAVADAVMTARQMVLAYSGPMHHTDLLKGYEMGSLGADGYSPMMSGVSGSMLDPLLKRASALAEFGVTFRILVIVLQRLGEDIDY